MKITESEIIKYIKEEMNSDSALADAIERLSDKVDHLDVSIDYLASALTGEDVFDIGLSQKALGRLRSAPTANVSRSDVSEDVLPEGHYHDMGGEHELYNALDPYNFEKMTDAQLVEAMYTEGMEELVRFDGEGDLVDREKIIAALKNV